MLPTAPTFLENVSDKFAPVKSRPTRCFFERDARTGSPRGRIADPTCLRLVQEAETQIQVLQLEKVSLGHVTHVPSPFSNAPLDIVLHILKMTDTQSLCRWALVSRQIGKQATRLLYTHPVFPHRDDSSEKERYGYSLLVASFRSGVYGALKRLRDGSQDESWKGLRMKSLEVHASVVTSLFNHFGSRWSREPTLKGYLSEVSSISIVGSHFDHHLISETEFTNSLKNLEVHFACPHRYGNVSRIPDGLEHLHLYNPSIENSRSWESVWLKQPLLRSLSITLDHHAPQPYEVSAGFVRSLSCFTELETLHLKGKLPAEDPLVTLELSSLKTLHLQTLKFDEFDGDWMASNFFSRVSKGHPAIRELHLSITQCDESQDTRVIDIAERIRLEAWPSLKVFTCDVHGFVPPEWEMEKLAIEGFSVEQREGALAGKDWRCDVLDGTRRFPTVPKIFYRATGGKYSIQYI